MGLHSPPFYCFIRPDSGIVNVLPKKGQTQSLCPASVYSSCQPSTSKTGHCLEAMNTGVRKSNIGDGKLSQQCQIQLMYIIVKGSMMTFFNVHPAFSCDGRDSGISWWQLQCWVHQKYQWTQTKTLIQSSSCHRSEESKWFVWVTRLATGTLFSFFCKIVFEKTPLGSTKLEPNMFPSAAFWSQSSLLTAIY